MTGVWQAPAASSPLANGARGTETILVVEDEDAVRGLVDSILELHGYRVLVASSAGEALSLAAGYDRRIDLLLTDLAMPDMNGRELAQRLRTARPEMRLLYMSGHTGFDLAGFGVIPGGDLFLEKPFTIAALTDRVREVLDNQRW